MVFAALDRPSVKRPWFSRRWIVQECCNAREIILLCGLCELSWKDFSRGLDVLTRAAAAQGDHHLEKYSAHSLLIWRNRISASSMIDDLDRLQDFRGKDDRDRIAAFLGLRWPNIAYGSDFRVDYSEIVEANY